MGVPLTQKGATVLTLAAVQGAFGLYYVLDSFDLSPYSTMLWGAKIDIPNATLPGAVGLPMHFLVSCQIAQVVAVVCAALVPGALVMAKKYNVNFGNPVVPAASLVAMCLALPSFMALFEGSSPEWQQDGIG